ncbi:MAG TPA: ECF transporter S component [Clostridiales bacterium]|nr:ECF transporter S component [Clostridiales bacterium]
MNNNLSPRTVKMVLLAILAAIMLILAFTPLGYLKVGIIEISFMMVPVAVGAIVLGPAAGAVLGGVFGITSFIQALTTSPFGAMLISINPFYTFILCMIPRILMGWLAGLVFQWLYKNDKTKIISYGTASLSAALFNTIFFMTFLILLFGNTDYIKGFQGNMSILAFVVAFVGINGLVEAIATTIIGGAVSRALIVYRQ